MDRIWIVAWYREPDWPEWTTVYDFTGRYDDWLARAEAGAKARERDGYNVAKVVIEPGKFTEWSKVNGGVVDGEARTRYAISLFHERSGD